MRIMVFDVPAENGGALTILNQYYEEAVNDKENEWIFIVSTPKLYETDNVKIMNYPWIKKSWFHRLYFDYFIAHKIVVENNIDEILSLQNLIIHKIKTRQVLYLHQSLPFIEKRFKFIENTKFWIYQNIISKMIYRSITKADKVIVQTNWMKDVCVKKTNVNPSKIVIEPPKIKIQVKKQYKQENTSQKLFFYPANSALYKNHRIIIEAMKDLKNINDKYNYKVVFTLKGNENRNIRNLYMEVQKFNLPITFVGSLSIEEVYEYYSKAILIFPSYLESFGLPLLEAKIHDTPILASDCAFSHEILDDYKRVKYFSPNNYKELSYRMKHIIENSHARAVP